VIIIIEEQRKALRQAIRSHISRHGLEGLRRYMGQIGEWYPDMTMAEIDSIAVDEAARAMAPMPPESEAHHAG
jgi:hypothetical protein